MASLYLILVFVLIIFSQWFVRDLHFNRKGKLDYIPDGNIRSPVDGVVCYIRKVTDYVAHKRCDQIDLNIIKGDFFQVGIYMSGYDRHYVTSPVCGHVNDIRRINFKNKMVSMIDFWNFFRYYYLGITPKLVNTENNLTYVYMVGDVYLAVISDKYVGKLDNQVLIHETVDQKTVLNIIRRGSQVDLFIPSELFSKLKIKETQQVRIGDLICLI